MKKVFLMSCLFSLLALAGYAQDDSDIIKVGDPMPAFNIVSDHGKVLSSSAFQGKVVLISFFATWCPPCQKELAEVEATLWPAFSGHKDFSLIVIGREHSDEELKVYNEKKGFTFPLYPDKDRAIYSKFANSLIPRCYLVGKDGKVIYTSKGYTEEEFSEMMEKIEKALK
ncbi:MAG: TlpA family protein disulfide reductase [Tannerellaceae bacterium]|nr:TlpA family protein disulfide reductase [Tannerellaceae bacterium]